MNIEQQLEQLLEDSEFAEVRARAHIRHVGERLNASVGRVKDEFDAMMDTFRRERELLVRDITGYAEEVTTGLEYVRPPRIIYEEQLPHEQGYDPDPHNLYGHPEAAE